MIRDHMLMKISLIFANVFACLGLPSILLMSSLFGFIYSQITFFLRFCSLYAQVASTH